MDSTQLFWKAVRVDPGADGELVKLLCASVDGQRVWREEIHQVNSQTGERRLIRERYWTRNREQGYRTAEAALAAELEPVEDNQP